MWASRQNHRGFTIIELIIVIVVIGILAAITTITYRGTQDRARFDAYRNDLVRINEAITVYHGETGRFPLGDGSSLSGCVTGTGNFITGLAPSYISRMPDVPNYNSGANYYAYCWNGSGAEYKLLRLVPSGTVPSVEQSSSVTMDPNRGWRGWGFWSPGGSAL
jgi:general secretion pathway protein G